MKPRFMIDIATGEFNGLTVRQISEGLPVSESTVRRAMRKADYQIIRTTVFETLTIIAVEDAVEEAAMPTKPKPKPKGKGRR